MASQMTVTELAELISSGKPYILLDIRSADDFAAGHIDGAINVPAEAFSLDAIPADTPLDTPIAVICYRGIMSRQAAPYVSARGFTDVRSVKGGMAKWKKTQG